MDKKDAFLCKAIRNYLQYYADLRARCAVPWSRNDKNCNPKASLKVMGFLFGESES